MSKHAENQGKVYVNADGERVMRVTEVIRCLAKEQINFWANMLGFKGVSYKKELDRTANIGSMCHGIIENYTNPNRLAIIDYDEFHVYDDYSKVEVRRALDSFFKWFEGMKDKYKVISTELTVVGKSLGGTIDCIIEDWDNPKKVIFVDYKTSSDFYLTQFLQLVGYVMIYEEVYGKDTVSGVMVVRLDKKNGRRAEAKLLRSDKMKLLKLMFKSLFEVAWSQKMLNDTYLEMLETIY